MSCRWEATTWESQPASHRPSVSPAWPSGFPALSAQTAWASANREQTHLFSDVFRCSVRFKWFCFAALSMKGGPGHPAGLGTGRNNMMRRSPGAATPERGPEPARPGQGSEPSMSWFSPDEGRSPQNQGRRRRGRGAGRSGRARSGRQSVTSHAALFSEVPELRQDSGQREPFCSLLSPIPGYDTTSRQFPPPPPPPCFRDAKPGPR